MKKLFSISLTAIALGLVIPVAHADVIGGPTLDQLDGGWVDTGIGFTANVSSTLTSFVFQNQGQADDVILENGNGVVLDSVNIPSGNDSDTVDVSWALIAGTQYYLLQTTDSNNMYTAWGQSAPSDTQITLTDTGIFSGSPDPAQFGITGTTYWAAFNNITTDGSASPVPEPSTFLTLGSGLIGLGGMLRRKFARG